MSRVPYSTLGEITELNNLNRFLARREQHRRQLLRDINSEIGATPSRSDRGSPTRAHVGRTASVRPGLDPITALALIGLGWLLGLLVAIAALFALIKWLWDLVMKLGGTT